MKDIRIQKLTLENFKCHKSLTIDFGGRETSIYGDNATGKSSIYDGLTWLLFGKDSRGSADAEAIKPLGSDGQVADHQAVTAVEAEFLVDLGEDSEVTVLRRTLKEVWSSKRGCPTPEYSGNVSEYAVNGVPMKKNGFDAAVKELVGEGLFRMLTSVRYFSADLKWQERRAVLFDMVGNLTDDGRRLPQLRLGLAFTFHRPSPPSCSPAPLRLPAPGRTPPPCLPRGFWPPGESRSAPGPSLPRSSGLPRSFLCSFLRFPCHCEAVRTLPWQSPGFSNWLAAAGFEPALADAALRIPHQPMSAIFRSNVPIAFFLKSL